MQRLLSYTLTLFIIPTFSYAFFCPTNFSQINMGDSIETVTAACGKPANVEEKEEKPFNPQEWSYYLTQQTPAQFPAMATPTQKTSFSFDSNGILVNITVGGLGASSTSLCGGALVQLGDNTERVKAICGQPGFIQVQDSSLNDKPSVKVTILTYTSNPPVALIFRDGKLAQTQP